MAAYSFAKYWADLLVWRIQNAQSLFNLSQSVVSIFLTYFRFAELSKIWFPVFFYDIAIVMI